MRIKIFMVLISLFLLSCDGEYDGVYQLTYHKVFAESCNENEPPEIYSPDEITTYFKLEYESFSLPTYVFKHCETEKAKNCKPLYYFTPEDVHFSGKKLKIDEQRACGEKKHIIEAEFIKDL